MAELHYETIRVEKRDQVDWLTLNRPDALNAINTPMVTELRDYFGRLYEDTDTRIVVLRGAGRAFCAGFDIKQAGSARHHTPFGGGMGFTIERRDAGRRSSDPDPGDRCWCRRRAASGRCVSQGLPRPEDPLRRLGVRQPRPEL